MMVCVCVCVVVPFILDVRFVDVPAGVTQEEGRTGFLHLPSAVLDLIPREKDTLYFYIIIMIDARW